MLRDGRSDELRREYAGTDVRSDELKEFYHNFDTTFLGLFPSFIGEFNRLLADDARIGVRRPGSLTTELRIFALVRLGITDTATIAALLRSIRCTATVRACGCVRSFRSGISNSGCSPSVSGTMPRSFPEPDRNGASCRRNTEFFRSGCTLRRGNAYICSSHIPIR